jgi:CMP/dCMP kinase
MFSMIITIDGPAGAGKSSVARALADRLQFEFLDTGAMYRAVAWACVDASVSLDDPNAITEVANSADFNFGQEAVVCDGRDVTFLIRSGEASKVASIVAAVPRVRDVLVKLQRETAAGRDLVTEGRDQGSIVFPDAECKFYLTADPKERARRRLIELEEQGQAISLDEVLAQIVDRDERDRNREVAPLMKPSDAVEIDTSTISRDEVIDWLESHARVRLGI